MCVMDTVPCELNSSGRVAERHFELLIEGGGTTQGDGDLHIALLFGWEATEVCFGDRCQSLSFGRRTPEYRRCPRRRHDRVPFEFFVGEQF